MRSPAMISTDAADGSATSPPQGKVLSIVVPVFCEEENLAVTVPTLLALEPSLEGLRIELVFVDDGSRDRSLSVLLDAQREHPDKIVIVQFSRNFGSMAAVQAGFAHATGDCVAALSADLQDPPELLVQMAGHWRAGVKAIFAVRSEREDSWVQRVFSSAFYRLFRRYAIADFPSGGFDLMLLDRQVVDELVSINEKNTHLMSLIFWLGHAHVLIPYVRRSRNLGQSKWTLAKKLKLFLDSFVAFSYAPIRTLSMLGLIFAVGAFLYAGVVLLQWLTLGARVEGWTALMIFISFTAGVQMTMLGVLGEYLWRTLDEVRRRPNHVVERVYKG